MAKSRCTALRELIFSKDLAFLMEAHNGISAKIAEETGFKGLWASGLTISASLGLRDSNEASWTQVLDVLEYMADATTLPILVDGDTGIVLGSGSQVIGPGLTRLLEPALVAKNKK